MFIIRRILSCCIAVALVYIFDVVLLTLVASWGIIPLVLEPPGDFNGNVSFIWALILDGLYIWELMLLPSMFIFLTCERLLPRRRRAKHVAFILSLLPVTAILVLVSVGSPGETASPAETLQAGFTYFSQAIAAYIVLILTSPRKRPDGAGG